MLSLIYLKNLMTYNNKNNGSKKREYYYQLVGFVSLENIS